MRYGLVPRVLRPGPSGLGGAEGGEAAGLLVEVAVGRDAVHRADLGQLEGAGIAVAGVCTNPGGSTHVCILPLPAVKNRLT